MYAKLKGKLRMMWTSFVSRDAKMAARHVEKK